MYHLHWCIF